MSDVEINGVAYTINRLDSFDQWHVARKLMPFMPAMLPILRAAAAAESGSSMSAEEQDKAFMPMANALAQMTDADSNSVMNKCLDVVRRRDATGTLRPVRVPGSQEGKGQLLFESEMNFVVLAKLVMEVCKADIFPSLGELLPGLIGAPNGAGTDPQMTISGSQTG